MAGTVDKLNEMFDSLSLRVKKERKKEAKKATKSHSDQK